MSDVGGPEMVRELQERAAQALPAEYVKDIGGWWLRYAPSCSWWVGTVLPHGDCGPDELTRRVVEAEEFYAERETVPTFQITAQACPEGLDGVLAERGYRRQSSVSLQAAATARVLEQPPVGPLQVRLDDRPTRDWLDTWLAVNSGEFHSELNMLGRVEPPSAYVSAMIGDDVVAVGRAVADAGWVGVFGMATLPQARGKGAARTVLAALAEWAHENEVGHMYLQVECDNNPAVRLYGRAGFSEVRAYHYRTLR